MAGQAASRALIDTESGFRQRSPRKPKRVWMCYNAFKRYCYKAIKRCVIMHLRDSQFNDFGWYVVSKPILNQSSICGLENALQTM